MLELPPIIDMPKPAIIRPGDPDFMPPDEAGIIGAVVRRKKAAQTDPNFANVSLLLHFDGADASTTFTDRSANGHTPTVNGNAQIDTAQSVFGGASGLFDGTGDYLSYADHASFDLGTGDFTIEFRLRVPGTGSLLGILGRGDGGSAGTWSLFFNNGSPHLTFQADGDTYDAESAANSISANTWVAVALVRSGTSVQWYIDGAASGSAGTYSGDMSNALALTVGRGLSTDLNGWLDELRITKGVARYTGTYTPASEAFPDA
jgi:hypothetical protein